MFVKSGQLNIVNHPAEDGATPLYLAAQEGHSRIVQVCVFVYHLSSIMCVLGYNFVGGEWMEKIINSQLGKHSFAGNCSK